MAVTARDERKARQLCRQVERTVGYVLSGELDDDRVRDLHVEDVQPAPHSHHLMVTLRATEPLTEIDLQQLNVLMRRYRGRIRAAVAADINRRKTPDLSFMILPQDLM